MPTEKRVPSLIVNTLTEAQYQALENPSDTEMWVTPYNESILPSQTGQSGKFLTTDGTVASWAAVDTLPNQTGQSGKFLTTDGSSASWGSVDISGKANVSLDNLSSAGDIYGSKLGMPSSTYTDLTLGASGTTYTAPANGWAYFSTWTTATAVSYFQLANLTTNIGILPVPAQGAGYQQKGYIPCRKGDTIYLAYDNLDMSRTQLTFVYAEGSKTEAN